SSRQWISSMAGKIQSSTEIVLGFSPYYQAPGLLNAFIRFESLLTGIQFMSLAQQGRPYMGVGRNLAYRRKLFLNTKGFNAHLGVTGGDDDLFVNQHATRENTAVCMGSESLVFSRPKTTWRDFLHQKLRHLSVGRRYRFLDKVWLGLLSGSWMLTWFLVLPGLFFLPLAKVLLGFFVIRMIAMVLVMQFGPPKLGASFEAWKAPLLDFMYAFYYLVTGAKALVVKKVKWKI
ncbi:MAG TPA: glycosyltransferase family 2 protein, partial [Cyclobacteriaceae bacterium]|nr:glycosyltransferase family 2 protein [Cyclobacteriaceae bacterium]